MTMSLSDRIKHNRQQEVTERRAQMTPLEVPVPAELADPKPIIRRPMVPPQSRKPEWQRFNRQQPRRNVKGASVTIHRGGRNIAFSQDALMALGLPHAVEAYFCGEPWMIGFRSGRTDDDQAFTLLAPSKGSARSISCTAFIQRTGVDASVGRRYKAVMQGDMLVVSLDADNAVELAAKAVQG